MKKSKMVLVIAAVCCLLAAACGKQTEQPTEVSEEPVEEKELQIGIVTDAADITQDMFQNLVFEGAEAFADGNSSATAEKAELTEETNNRANIDRLVGDGSELIISSTFALAGDMKEAAAAYPEQVFLVVDHTYMEEELLDNLGSIRFEDQMSAFLVGYIAGNVTEANKVGFVGGVLSEPTARFEYGYRAGVEHAAKELGKEITVDVVYTDTFTDPAVGKEKALELYANKCDIIFQAAGECGKGVIEAAGEADQWVIGVDTDQYELDEDHVLTSAVKKVDVAVQQICQAVYDGDDVGGQVHVFGIEEGCVGIPDSNPNLEKYPQVYEKVLEIQKQIERGTIQVPEDQKEYEAQRTEEGNE